jgi:hypothetical protein
MLKGGEIMFQKFVRRLLLIAVLMLTGCTCKDGSFTYYCTVTVVTSENQPVANVQVIVFDNAIDTPEDYADIPSRFATTDAQGVAHLTVLTGNAWGGCPGPAEAPIPDNPGTLVVWVKSASNTWRQIVVAIQDSQITGRRKGELDIDLGTITRPAVKSV